MKKYIDKILNRYGYYRFDLPQDAKVSEGDMLEMFSSYGENEVFTRFLRDLCAQDIRLYFQATNDRDRQTIRGAHDRCYYFLSLIQKSYAKGNKPGQGKRRISSKL